MATFGDRLRAAAAVARTTMVPFERPDRVPRALLAAAPWGIGVAGLVAAAAARYPTATALVDDDGPVSYRDLWRASGGIARELHTMGATGGTGVGIMCRNHRGFVEAFVAVARTGADVVLMNTGFAGPQLADVAAQEGVRVLVHDADLADAAVVCAGVRCVDEHELAEMGANARLTDTLVPHRAREGRIVILTSGTTGRPKGAARSPSASASAGAAGLLVRIPLRPRDVQVVPPPLFHAWGFSHLLLGLSRSATTIVSRRFDPVATLRSIDEHRARVLAVVPVMLQRILAIDPAVLDSFDTSTLEVIAASGSALGGKNAEDALARFGDVLYNVYGSTEVAVASIAAPEDLRRAPTTVGRVAPGVQVEVLDARGEPVPDGTVGRIFVGSGARFEGYTTGGTKEVRRGLMSSGDRGHFDGDLLFVDGRDDDMVISGGENLFPGEVEDLLLRHASIADVAVVGVPDEEFGQVLAAFVVRAPGAEITAGEVRAHVRERLARFKVPKRVDFVDEVPRNPTGKILRRNLSESV
jgi:fatty-acyl-CoA synthase